MRNQDTAIARKQTQQVEALKLLAFTALTDALTELLNEGPALLVELAQSCRNDRDQRQYLDCVGLIRSAQPAIKRDFKQALAVRFAPSKPGDTDSDTKAFSVGELTLQDPSELDRTILLGRVVAHADNRHENLLREIRPRIDRWIFVDGARIAPDALWPAGICQAYMSALGSLHLDVGQTAAMLEL